MPGSHESPTFDTLRIRRTGPLTSSRPLQGSRGELILRCSWPFIGTFIGLRCPLGRAHPRGRPDCGSNLCALFNRRSWSSVEPAWYSLWLFLPDRFTDCSVTYSLLLLCGEIGLVRPRGTSLILLKSITDSYHLYAPTHRSLIFDSCLPLCCVAHTALFKLLIFIITLWYGYLQNYKLPQTRRIRRRGEFWRIRDGESESYFN